MCFPKTGEEKEKIIDSFEIRWTLSYLNKCVWEYWQEPPVQNSDFLASLVCQYLSRAQLLPLASCLCRSYDRGYGIGCVPIYWSEICSQLGLGRGPRTSDRSFQDRNLNSPSKSFSIYGSRRQSVRAGDWITECSLKVNRFLGPFCHIFRAFASSQ